MQYIHLMIQDGYIGKIELLFAFDVCQQLQTTIIVV